LVLLVLGLNSTGLVYDISITMVQQCSYPCLIFSINIYIINQSIFQSTFMQPIDQSLNESMRKCFQECASENRSMIYDLIASHGDIEDMIFFAVLIQGKRLSIGMDLLFLDYFTLPRHLHLV